MTTVNTDPANRIASTPQPPYYAVIFTSVRTGDDRGYRQTAERMMELASRQPGFLGVESARETVGITVSYWRDLSSIKAWKADAHHRTAQETGRKRWYSEYRIRICRVTAEYGFTAT